ncbi:hypothetical protein MLD38_011061 [Melastoma candidum]|uniref:Uncharacterized protein n=1 Tax=Melastoma candidum TaxID=119954 RepID=A0ACB9RA68_9MYRT|nr:hypothetical protein MLD38_011061 [Melastoma candidum]
MASKKRLCSTTNADEEHGPPNDNLSASTVITIGNSAKPTASLVFGGVGKLTLFKFARTRESARARTREQSF